MPGLCFSAAAARMRVADAVRNVDVYIEQPCLHYEECLAVRHHTNRPFALDETIDDVHMALRGYAGKAMDIQRGAKANKA